MYESQHCELCLQQRVALAPSPRKKTLAVPEPPGLQQQLLSLMFPLQLL